MKEEERKPQIPKSLLRRAAPPNNGMYPTADTQLLMYINRSGRRVVLSVRWLLVGC